MANTYAITETIGGDVKVTVYGPRSWFFWRPFRYSKSVGSQQEGEEMIRRMVERENGAAVKTCRFFDELGHEDLSW